MEQTGAVGKDMKVQRRDEPGVNVAVKVSSQQNINGAVAAEHVGADNDGDDVNAACMKSKKGWKKKKKKHSSSSSDGDESDDDNDRKKSKKKATAGVSTRINIFTGGDGAPGVGMQSGIAGPSFVSSMNAPVPMIQQMPMLSMFEPVAINTGASTRSTKKAKLKSSSAKPAQAPAMIPTGAVGLGSGFDGHDVLLIPIPHGMKLPPLGTLNDMFGQGIEAPSKKKKRTSEKSGSTGVLAGPPPTAFFEERGAQIAGAGMVEIAGGTAPEGQGSAALTEEQHGRRLEEENGDSEQPPPDLDMSPVTPKGEHGPDDKSPDSSDSESNVLAFIILAAVVAIIIVVLVVFIIFSSNSSKPPTAVPIHHESGYSRRRVVRRHPRPVFNLTQLFRRFKRPLEAYWNIPI